ncbi:MAG: hypothetical protein M4579_003492 [Chaenotheca gracillima]|nr:MAG: hypothetical protein M4579_003492 [Chaenotheca gracillima]
MKTSSTLYAALLALLAVPLVAVPISPECQCENNPHSFTDTETFARAKHTTAKKAARPIFSFMRSTNPADPDDDAPTPTATADGDYPLTTAQLLALSRHHKDRQGDPADAPSSAPTSALPLLQREEARRMSRCQELLAMRLQSQRRILFWAGLATLTSVLVFLVFVVDSFPRARPSAVPACDDAPGAAPDMAASAFQTTHIATRRNPSLLTPSLCLTTNEMSLRDDTDQVLCFPHAKADTYTALSRASSFHVLRFSDVLR